MVTADDLGVGAGPTEGVTLKVVAPEAQAMILDKSGIPES